MNINALSHPVLGLAAGVWLAICGLPLPQGDLAFAAAAAPSKKSAPQKAALSVYEKQPPVTEKELLRFLDLLPQFRAWARAGNEEAHPILRNNKADFLYSPQAAAWVQEKGWNPVRFFCVMGRMAAALAIVEEGNEMGARSRDMPDVAEEELALARKHLGSILKAGSSVPPISR
ncbi:serine/threonine protein phosphatase [Desulfovibrio legallii]|jgi:hypothetical protein|uniref:Uncharacterized protein n=1 Tax=Desulfovibrio legallii TaxID=571438 RepID=A0A1G7PVI8_9BACT|nr:serine/threonine protein phosphatase [Desulfovibrio legallii]SDF89639.1 hypothetical protein SAMN05192586_11738 [Desulfovibrio legallii]